MLICLYPDGGSNAVIQGGMIPKLSACLRGLEVQSSPDRAPGEAPVAHVPVAHVIDGRRPEALLDCVRGKAMGTSITGDIVR